MFAKCRQSLVQMYETYYQLKTKPFTLLPDPEFLYLGAKHKMALSLLEYGLADGSAFIVITGHPGTGKTTLLNRLLDQSHHPWVIGILSNVHSGLGGLMPWIAASFGLPTNGKSEVDIFHEFARFLEHEHSIGRRVLLILDEAQNVGAGVLEELRLLSNLNDGRRRSLQILLSGQRGLQDLLKGFEMVQFAQRIGVEYVLDGLSENETVAYIDHRLQVAGRSSQLFTTLAGRIAFRLTGGDSSAHQPTLRSCPRLRIRGTGRHDYRPCSPGSCGRPGQAWRASVRGFTGRCRFA
ncbi:MAG: AAA family ATPase [Nitrospira sp.]|nr:AAA family ATPase [Nitrospira sp.]